MGELFESIAFTLDDRDGTRDVPSQLRALLHRVLEDANALALSVGPWYVDRDNLLAFHLVVRLVRHNGLPPFEMLKQLDASNPTQTLRLVTHDDVDTCTTAIIAAAHRAGKPLTVHLSGEGSWLSLRIVVGSGNATIHGRFGWRDDPLHAPRSAQALGAVVDAWRCCGLVRP